jgi:hypothetical protein
VGEPVRKVFVHLHIPKCGGTSVAEVLSRNFGPDLGNTDSILNNYQYDADQVSKIIGNYPDLKCLTGHKLSLDLPFDRDDLDLQAFTWIRDPVDLFLSHYFFHRNHTSLVPEAKSMNLLEYSEWALKYENQQMYINGQTRFLSGGLLEIIKTKVVDGRLLLFPLSKLQESFYTLGHRFPNVFVDSKVRSRNASMKDQPIPDNFRELILPYVEDDMKLLELARQTRLETTMPRTEGAGSSGQVVSKALALKSARFLHRAANYIERLY